MKKYILVGVVLILAGLLWFLITMPEREGLANPACWENVLDGSSGNYISGYYQAEMAIRGPQVFTSLDEAKTACESDTACKGVVGGLGDMPVQRRGDPPPPPRTLKYAKFSGDDTPSTMNMTPLPPPNTILYYRKKPCSSTPAPPPTAPAPPPTAPAPPAPGCPTNGEGITSIIQSGGQNVRLYTQPECKALNGNWVGNGNKSWGMQTDMVGECIGVPGQNIGFCNQSAPPSAAAKAVETPPPPPPPAPTPAPVADPQIGTLISLLQQDIASRQSSLLNTANNPAIPVGSLLSQTTVNPNWKPIPNATIPGPDFSGMNAQGPLDEIPKSSLVPCTCPTYTMSCPVHAGSRPSSQAPGDADSALSRAQDQYDMMRPFNKTDDVPGFLNTFSNFGN